MRNGRAIAIARQVQGGVNARMAVKAFGRSAQDLLV